MRMVRSLAVLAALVLTSVLGGCGSGSDDPTATETEPVWPPPGCDTVSGAEIDYATDAGGAATPEEAALEHVSEGASVVRAPKAPPHERRMWWVLDQSGTAIAAVAVFKTSDGGWLVDSDERCADR